MAPTRSGQKGAPKKLKREPTASKNKARKQSTHNQAEPQPAEGAGSRTKVSRGRKRKVRDTEIDEIAVDEPVTRKYVQLAPATRRIPQQTIDTWPQVSPHLLEQIVAVLQDAKNDIVNTRRDRRKIDEADEILNMHIRALGRQLSRSRIPAQAKDIQFNVDKLTERNAQVYRQVTTARHSNQVLKEQVKVAEHLLGKDEESLEHLKRRAKKWGTEWKHQEKRGTVHPLLQDLENAETGNDGPEDIALKQSVPTDTSALDVPDSDSELAPLLEQLRRSLENMQGNHVQVEGIDGAMLGAQAALDDMLFRHGSAQ
ncbi:CENP-Q, a CENPA-CAD centromere complex subunit-domain-containing protein [Massariosphaeria phaeospora]|uniref:CENP-Q, a CENPA-CAD centromere complex subunit-domain-containing protein n=1 Tax=Massariosphaeria phaeospora TaxID=100035 RepID=A0A7C8I7Z2_9PLEO|nr:CENP-Q, a CENPA-CAD centromere complex subunit-domain-containing protein [Massariosphaeria phaeospora]